MIEKKADAHRVDEELMGAETTQVQSTYSPVKVLVVNLPTIPVPVCPHQIIQLLPECVHDCSRKYNRVAGLSDWLLAVCAHCFRRKKRKSVALK